MSPFAPFQPMARPRRLTAILLCATFLAGCTEGGLDLDLRGAIGGVFSTTEAARTAQSERPAPDARGIISYPNYQVAVAQPGDTLTSLANRIGLPAGELARYNGVQPDDALRAGEVIALPRRVAEPVQVAEGEAVSGIRPASQVDITQLATVAIDSAPETPVTTQDSTAQAAVVPVGREPVRHKVERGETAYSLARRYGIPVQVLADWNGLDETYTLRAGQYLLIPAADNAATQLRAPSAIVVTPGQNSIAPPPPSALRPLPEEETTPVAERVEETLQPQQQQTAAPARNDTELLAPVDGTIIRDYVKGRTDGIYLSAAAGTPVRAANGGVVGAVTSDQRNQTAIVIKHDDNLLTAYANVGDVTVKKGDRVTRGQTIGKLRAGATPFVDFRVYRGSESVDPTSFIQ